jgi:hypothetical protein
MKKVKDKNNNIRRKMSHLKNNLKVKLLNLVRSNKHLIKNNHTNNHSKIKIK